MEPTALTRDGTPIYFHAPKMLARNLSKLANHTSTTFNAVCPRGSLQRYLVMRVAPIAASVITVTVASNQVGSYILHAFEGEGSNHTTNHGVGDVLLDTYLGLVSMAALVGSCALAHYCIIPGIKNCFKVWRDSELKEVDLEKNQITSARNHRAD